MTHITISKDAVDCYRDKQLVVYTLGLSEEFREDLQKWKKKVEAPYKWQELRIDSVPHILKKHNALGVLTGKVSNIFVLDIDTIPHWIEWLTAYGRLDEWKALEDSLVTVETASGGFHYYFLYTDALATIRGTSNCFGGHWGIDSRTNGNFVFAPPTSLITENVQWQYKWVRSVFDYPLVELPAYIIEWLVERPGKRSTKTLPKRLSPPVAPVDIVKFEDLDLGEISSGGREISTLLKMIDIQFWDNYDHWIHLGSNIKSLELPENEKFQIWKTFSQISANHKTGDCEGKWGVLYSVDKGCARNFIKSMARQSDPEQYAEITGEKPLQANDMDIVTDFVANHFRVGEHRVRSAITKSFENASYIIVNLDETYCNIIKGEHEVVRKHENREVKPANTAYVVIGDKFARLKCHNSACATKIGKEIVFSKYNKEMKKIVHDLLSAPNEVASSVESIINPGKDYATVKREFEKEWFALCYPAVFVQIKRDTIRYFSLSGIKHGAKFATYETIATDRRGSKRVEEMRFLDKWLDDPAQRHYDTLDFLPPPLSCPADVYNTFQGFLAEGLPPVPSNVVVDFEPIMTLLFDLCDRQHDPKNYILDWLAHMVQCPAVLPRTGVIIKSKQGRGKNMLFGNLVGEKILGGRLYKTSARADDFFGRFANGFVHRLLCNFNEVSSKDTNGIMGAVKETITEPVLSYEKKGADVVEIRNCARQLWFSNEEIPIKLTHDDRRWLAVQASDCMPETGSPEHQSYFSRVKDWIADDTNVRGFFDFLRERNITDWIPENRPRTSFYTALQQLSLGRVDQWLVNRLESASLPTQIIATQLARDLEMPNTPTLSTKMISRFMEPYIGKGVEHPPQNITIRQGIYKGRGKGYEFNSVKLTATLVAMYKMDPIFIDESDDD